MNSLMMNSKIKAALVLGIGSILFGMLPSCISRRTGRFPLLASVFLCFGAGVLLATSIVHMLPEVRKSMPNNAEVVVCGGFFLIYFIDEFINFFFGDAIHNVQSDRSSNSRIHENGRSHQDYGSLFNSERSSLIHNHDDVGNDRTHIQSRTSAGTFGLIVALSLHSLIEGLAIGVQTSQAKVLVLLLAVSCHKFVMAFCLGLECCATSFKSHFISILVFSLGSVVGILVGTIITDIPAAWQKNGLPILQAIASGTILYITVCEVMPREKAKWHLSGRKFVGMIQYISIATGFSFMVIANFYLNDN